MVSEHADYERALAALWQIRMAAERLSVDDPIEPFLNTVIMLAENGMGSQRRTAQRLAAARINGSVLS